MADCTPEFWSLKEIYESLSKGRNGKKKIVIPMFQRGKRWKADKEESFIDSLKKKYPIGTLLFYRTTKDDQEIYTLIDGLQRGTTIRKYLSSPTMFFKLDQIPNETLETIHTLSISQGGNIEIQKSKVDEILVNYVKSLKTFDDFEIAELFSLISKEMPLLSTHLVEFTACLKPVISSIRDDYNSLSGVQIPAIVYTGPESTLPEIFERINSKGVALTEYEIYAASWPAQKFFVSNDKVIEKVLAKYDLLNDSDYELSGYNRNETRINKKLNAFEYVFGLSKWLQDEFESLGFYKTLKADETNPFAFQLINACFNTSHGQIKDVYKIILKYSNDISKLEESIVSSINFVEKCIEPIVKFKGNTRSEKTKILHSQYQIMSLIAFVFRKKYNPDLTTQENWKESKVKLENNIWKYYVYDVLIKFWGEGGTGKIHTANSENRYFNEITKGQFANAIDNYNEDCLQSHEARNVRNPIDKDYVILNTIYLSTFTAMDQLSLDKFDVEHIATKDQMKSLIEKTNGTDIGLPISHIANLCYLPEDANRSKGSMNFYQDEGYLKKSSLTLGTIESKYSFTKKEDLDWMGLEYTNVDFGGLDDYFKEFLQNRYKVIKQKFLIALGFTGEEGAVVESDDDLINNSSLVSFDDQFFRMTKIGVLVKKSFEYLLFNNKMTDDDLFNLKDREYCLRNLGCAFPFLIEDESQMKDENGRNRYWNKPYIVGSHCYYFCSQWFESDRKKVVPWLKKKFKNEVV